MKTTPKAVKVKAGLPTPAVWQDRKERERMAEQTFTRRQFMTYAIVIETGTPIPQAIEAVATTAMEHPDWDMDEEMTWAQWQERRAS